MSGHRREAETDESAVDAVVASLRALIQLAEELVHVPLQVAFPVKILLPVRTELFPCRPYVAFNDYPQFH